MTSSRHAASRLCTSVEHLATGIEGPTGRGQRLDEFEVDRKEWGIHVRSSVQEGKTLRNRRTDHVALCRSHKTSKTRICFECTQYQWVLANAVSAIVGNSVEAGSEAIPYGRDPDHIRVITHIDGDQIELRDEESVLTSLPIVEHTLYSIIKIRYLDSYGVHTLRHGLEWQVPVVDRANGCEVESIQGCIGAPTLA